MTGEREQNVSSIRRDVAAGGATEAPATGTPGSNRRSRSDRRVDSTGPGEGGRRNAPRSRLPQWTRVVGRDVLMIAATLGAIIASVHYTKPIFTNQPSVVRALTERPVISPLAPIAKAALDSPRDSALNKLTGSPEFERDKQAFAADLVATGRMTQARADTIAFYAVREAYVRKIPPAVIFGVMLTENAQFVSKALSDVGAVGLMQVYPKVWLKALTAKFGGDLATDSTNLKYGVYILAEYIKTNQGQVGAATLNKGLLRYNGCVRGAHTPHCKNYPSKVRKYVEQSANALCGDKSFYTCIAKPFAVGLFGKDEEEAVK